MSITPGSLGAFGKATVGDLPDDLDDSRKRARPERRRRSHPRRLVVRRGS